MAMAEKRGEKMKKLIYISVLLIMVSTIQGKEIKNIDFDWKFISKDITGAEKKDYDDSSWNRVDLPHDWSIEMEYTKNVPGGGSTGFLPIGIGWYRKEINIPENWIDQNVFIHFDGVFMLSDTYINGHHLGQWQYGYTSFQWNMAPYLKPGKNIIAVRVDHSKGAASRWYAGCGIYGHVDLIVSPELFIPVNGGVFVRTLSADKKHAKVAVDTEIRNKTGKSVQCTVVQTIKTKNGKIISTDKKTAVSKPKELELVQQELIVKSPSLWSPDTPHLYELETMIMDGSVILEKTTTTIGIRQIEYKSDTGFWLNGKNIKMKGVCEHHDGGVVGAAFPDDMLEWRIQILKDMGCNAIRTAHNPRTPKFYEICDRMGMMVMDEIFDGWVKKAGQDYGGRFFKEHWKKDVRSWIRRDRNHPSIVMYSIGNETGHSDRHDITGYIHQFDQSRPTTGGTVLTGVDIPGLNGPGEEPGALPAFKKKYPDKPLVLTEAPHTTQTRGFYRVPTWWRNYKKKRNTYEPYGTKQIFFDGAIRYSSSYDNSGVRITARQNWKNVSSTPWVIGEFRWTGFDYLGENTFGGGSWPSRAWNFGIIDLAGFPKDHYYFYQSVWTEKPMVHILPHWTHRYLKKGTRVPVVAYSTLNEVELFLNGKSLGRKKKSDLFEFVWNVPYEPGELKAIAYKNNKKEAEMIYKTAKNPVKLVLTAESHSLKNDKRDTTHINISTIDEKGIQVPWTDNLIEFKIDGPVKLLGFENGDILDVMRHRINRRKLFNGLARGFFQGTDKTGSINITAAAILGSRLFQNKTDIAIDVKQIALRGKLKKDSFKIYYTVDGSKPSTKSIRYKGK
jgi:beta-galactosidase